MRSSAITLLLAVLLSSCSGQKNRNKGKSSDRTEAATAKQDNKSASGSQLTYQLKFERRESFGTTDKVVVGKIASIVVDKENQVFIADEDQTTIEVFNPDGSYRTSLGRRGRGPGEFSTVAKKTVLKIHSDRLYVPDYINGSFFPTRLQVFSLDSLNFIRTIQLLSPGKIDYSKKGRYYPNRTYPRNDGTFLVGNRRFRGNYRDSIHSIWYTIMDSTGKVVKGPIFEQKDRRTLTYIVKDGYAHQAIASFPFFEKSLLAVSDKDKLYAARTGTFKINVYNPNGNYIRSFQHPFSNKPFNKSKIIDRYKKSGYLSGLGDEVSVKMIKNATDLPSTWPALYSMFFDDHDRLWVSTIIDSDKLYEWWILKKSGQVITKFKWPKDKPIKTVHNGFMYTQETNSKGIDQIVKYKIQFKKNK